MILLILSVFTLMLCVGGALIESRSADRLCDRLFEAIRGGAEYETVELHGQSGTEERERDVC